MDNKSLAVNAFSVDLEDWYPGIELPFASWGAHADRLRYGVDPLLQLLGMHNASATFFILGWIAKKYPERVKERAFSLI